MNEYFLIQDGKLVPIDAEPIIENGEIIGYAVECCACKWIKGYGECGHGYSDGLTSPHIHCKDHTNQ